VVFFIVRSASERGERWGERQSSLRYTFFTVRSERKSEEREKERSVFCTVCKGGGVSSLRCQRARERERENKRGCTSCRATASSRSASDVPRLITLPLYACITDSLDSALQHTPISNNRNRSDRKRDIRNGN
jgi:hypothetical protein